MTYRSKETIEAFLWTGGLDQIEDPAWICEAIRDGIVKIEGEGSTLEMKFIRDASRAIPGDYIVRYPGGIISWLGVSELNRNYEPIQPAPASTK